MKSMKKIVALLMVVMMLFAFAAVASAEETVDYTYAAQRLSTINVMKGDTSGNLMLDAGVTRYQAALFFVQALTGETAVEKWNQEKQSAVFSDVPEYGTAIDYANGIGLIRGRGEGIYGYNDPIIYQDMLVLAVRALGYETAEMSYPYGYVLAAEKLGLTDNLADGIANTQALTRGETAQIIWDMLNTQIAALDPVSEKILYPNEVSVSDAIFGTGVERTTLLAEAGFSSAVIESVIVEYHPAKTSKDIAYVVLENGMEISASDLGITARTNQSTFLGLPVTLYVDSASEAEFEQKYDIVEEDSEATIIFAEFLAFTDVKNIGDEGNIKVTVSTSGEKRITLGGTTFGENKNTFDVRVLTEDGWEKTDFEVLEKAFSYEDKEYTGTNSYGEISYAVVTEEVEGKTVSTVIMLYKPYEFGQYFTRTIRYQPTVLDESFITIGKYSETMHENADGDDTHFVEYILGSGAPVMDGDEIVNSVSKRDGEAAKETRISGGSVRAGNFIFYYYNELDNVLVIGHNCGGFETGNLTSQNASAQTVKVAGTTYKYGFAGAFDTDLPAFEDHDFANNYLASIESGKSNAKYVVLNDRIIYVEPNAETTKRIKHNYVIATTDEEVMADLLGLEVEDYEKKLTDDGVYVSDKGNMTIAVLNTTNGTWGLAEVAQFEYGKKGTVFNSYSGYDVAENEFPYVVDMKEHIENYNIFGAGYKNYDQYEFSRNMLLQGGMFTVRENASGVYKLAVMMATGEWGIIDNGRVFDGLYFSDAAPKTNDVIATRSPSKDPARVTLNANTVVVVVEPDGDIGVRVGIQGEDNSIVFEGTSSDDNIPGGFLYSASSSLIVLRLYSHSSVSVKDIDGNAFDIEDWAGEAAAGADETYFVGLNGAAVEYERLDDGTYELTVSDLYNLRTMRSVSVIKLNVEDLEDTDLEDADLTGEVLYMDKKGNLKIVDMELSEALIKSVNMRSEYDDDYYEITSDIEFVDDSSISVTIDETVLDKKNAVAKINVTVATLDVTDIDWENYDIDNIAYAVEYDEENEWGVGSVQFSKNKADKYYEYVISDINATETVTEPTAGIFDQYIIDTIGEELLVAETDGDYFDNAAKATVNLYACGQFDDDTGVVTLYVLKVLNSVESVEE